MNIISNGLVFTPYQCKTENVFEIIVAKLADSIFGDNTIYIDMKRKLKSKVFNVIPDGYLLDMTQANEPKFYIVENEIVGHDPYKHIGNQMLRFAINYEDSQVEIRKIVMQQILADEVLIKKLESNFQKSDARNIDAYLDRAIFRPFMALVVINEAKPELHKVLEKINADISVLELKSYVCNEEYLYQYDTLYDEENYVIEEKASVKLSVEQRKERLAMCDTIIVPAREDGFKEEFLENNQWFAIRINAAMKNRIKYIAGYQVAPISAVTHIAEIIEIKPYKDTGKYIVLFKGCAEKIDEVKLKNGKNSLQGCIYAQRVKLLNSEYLEDAL